MLPQLCAPLADAVTSGDDAVRRLDEIQQANLFLTASDDEGRWLRYHQLFRDLLRYELELSRLADPAVLHRRAAEWFRDQGEPGEAIGHAIALRDSGLAGALIGEAWRSELNLGHLQTVQGRLDALPSAQLAADLGVERSEHPDVHVVGRDGIGSRQCRTGLVEPSAVHVQPDPGDREQG